MWPRPWTTSTASGFQPASSYPGIHSSMSYPPSHYVTSQPSIPIPPSNYSALSHGEYPHSHSGMGIGYGIPGMGSGMMPMPVDQTVHHSVMDNTTPQEGVVYQQRSEEMSGVVRGIQPPSISPMQMTPTPPSTPSLQERSPLNQPIVSPHGGSGGGGMAYHQTSPPMVATPLQSNSQPYPVHGGSVSQHVHGSSPFSVDFILRERAPESAGGITPVLPNYVDSVPPPSEKGEPQLIHTPLPSLPHPSLIPSPPLPPSFLIPYPSLIPSLLSSLIPSLPPSSSPPSSPPLPHPLPPLPHPLPPFLPHPLPPFLPHPLPSPSLIPSPPPPSPHLSSSSLLPSYHSLPPLLLLLLPFSLLLLVVSRNICWSE